MQFIRHWESLMGENICIYIRAIWLMLSYNQCLKDESMYMSMSKSGGMYMPKPDN